MKINLMVVGRLKEKFLIDGVDEYVKRLKPFVKFEIQEILECHTPEQEGEKILSRVSKNSWLCVLDVAGESLDSKELAKRISYVALNGLSNLVFVIGGAFGLSEELRSAANLRLSLSRMTFTHQMTRLILVEQIYRAFKINHNEPYHW